VTQSLTMVADQPTAKGPLYRYLNLRQHINTKKSRGLLCGHDKVEKKKENETKNSNCKNKYNNVICTPLYSFLSGKFSERQVAILTEQQHPTILNCFGIIISAWNQTREILDGRCLKVTKYTVISMVLLEILWQSNQPIAADVQFVLFLISNRLNVVQTAEGMSAPTQKSELYITMYDSGMLARIVDFA